MLAGFLPMVAISISEPLCQYVTLRLYGESPKLRYADVARDAAIKGKLKLLHMSLEEIRDPVARKGTAQEIIKLKISPRVKAFLESVK